MADDDHTTASTSDNGGLRIDVELDPATIERFRDDDEYYVDLAKALDEGGFKNAYVVNGASNVVLPSIDEIASAVKNGPAETAEEWGTDAASGISKIF